MKVRGVEVMAGFSVACLLTLALFPQPLNVAARISACLFAAVPPMLICVRILMDDETQSPKGLSLSERLRFSGYLLAIAGFASLLSAAYWLACLVFCITAMVVFMAWIRAIHPTAIDKKALSPTSSTDQDSR